MIVTVTPNPSIDRTYELPVLIPGEVHRATRRHEEPSGKGVNVTRALTVNGIPSVAVWPCGGPAGTELAGLLEEENVRYRAVPVSGPVRTNISLTEPGGRTTKINEPGPALTAAELDQLTENALAAAGPGDWIVCSGRLPPGAPGDYYAHVGQRAHRAGVRFALDTSGEALAAGLDAAPEVVKPNVSELAEVTGTQIKTLGQAIICARELLARSATSVMVSLGPDGAALVTADGAWHAGAPAPAISSTVGAGDALLAGFLAAGGAGPPALREAVTWATAAIGVEGSHVPVISGGTRAAIRVEIADEAHLPLDRRLAGSG